jgi:DNA repair protein RadD
MICPHCNYEYPVKHSGVSANVDPVSKFNPPIELEVMDINYYVHGKKERVMMRVAYQLGESENISTYVCIEHGGYAEIKAREWLRKALPADYPIPDTVEQCLELQDVYKKPTSLFIDYNKKFPRIVSMIYPEIEKDEVFTEKMKEEFTKNFVR